MTCFYMNARILVATFVQTIMDANDYGVGVKMITGDHLLIAKETARQLEMGSNITDAAVLPMLDPVTKKKPENLSANFGEFIYSHDGFAQVYPEHKYLIVECLREMGYKTGMTGDGACYLRAVMRSYILTNASPGCIYYEMNN